MSEGTFYISTDADGKMPVLTRVRPAKRHYIMYVNNKPVKGVIPPSVDRVWDFSVNEMFGVRPGIPKFGGGTLPVTAARLEVVA